MLMEGEAGGSVELARGSMTTTTCSSCGAAVLDDARFCVQCGASQVTSCSACGTEVGTSFRFCPACGRPLGEPPAAQAREKGQRRRVTTLFADLVGFSTLAEYMDPEQLHTLLAEVFGDCTQHIKDCGGNVERFIGDSVLATFGAQQAHGDDPRRALDAAFRMLRSVGTRSEDSPAPLELRIGINSGLVVAGALGDHSEIFGDAVNVAARLQQAAAPGEVLVAASVWRRVRDRYEGEHVGALEVKGREQQVDTYRVLGPRPTIARKQAPFVGRRDELALLELLWSNSVKGNTHVVTLVGESGVGKSRLLSELPTREVGRSIRVDCESDQAAYGPFVTIIHRILGAPPSDLQTLQELCRPIDGVDDELAMLLGAMLGLTGAPPVVATSDDHQKRQVFAAVWLFLLAVAGEAPLLLILDDVHWADRSSLELIAFLLERLGSAPILLVLAYRPGFEHVERTAIRASHTGIRLEHLTPEDSVAVARGFLGVSELPEDLERLVSSRAEGNPFFIEELLQALLELGALAVRDGHAILARVDVEVPDTVEGTILARIDRQDPGARLVLQCAAAIGHNFSTELVAAVSQERELDRLMEELSRAQLIVARGPDGWSFKHALIREVTYDTLLFRQRRDIHRRVAEALEADGGSLELLAEHYGKAAVQEKARRYAMEAGDAATERMGYIEARDRYETALHLWGDGDEEGRLSLLMKLAYAELLSADQAAAATVLTEAEAGWRTLGNLRRAGEALATLGRVYFWTGEADRSDDAFRRAIAMLEEEGPSLELAKALTWASALKIITGLMDEGSVLASRGLAMDSSLLSPGARSSLLTTWGSCQVHMGNLEGLASIREALKLAEDCREAEALGRAYVNLGLCLTELYEPGALEVTRRGRQVTRKIGATSFEEVLIGREAGILAELGSYGEAEDLSREVLDVKRSVQVVPGLLFSGFASVQVSIRTGAYQRARSTLDELFPYARRVGGGMFLCQAFGLEAELEAARKNQASSRLAAAEGVRVAMATPSIMHAFHVLVPATRVLGAEVEPLLARLAAFDGHPAFTARVTEGRAILESDPSMFTSAADLYQSLDLPYQEARCRLDAGQRARSEELIDRFELRQGPLGAALAELVS